MKSGPFLVGLLMLFTGAAQAADEDSPFVFPTPADYPSIRRSAAKIADFVPANWAVMARANGDLNGDNAQDCVLYIKGTQPKYKQKNDGLGVDPFDTNPRMLLILFANTKGRGYKLAEESSSFIPIPSWPTLMEPFEKIAIKNGVLKIDLTEWYNAGSWSRTDTSYLFRYQKDKFVLIGAEHSELQRNSGQQHSASYNFLTGKMKLTSRNYFSEDNFKESVTWRKLPVRQLKALTTFNQLYEWQVVPGHYL